MPTKEFVEELDKILSGVPDEGGIYKHTIGKFSFEILGTRLAEDGYGKWLGGYEFEVYLRGVDYVKAGGYARLYSQIDSTTKKPLNPK